MSDRTAAQQTFGPIRPLKTRETPGDTMRGTEHRDRLLAELEGLVKLQFQAMQQATFAGMSSDEVTQYGERHRRITQLSKMLRRSDGRPDEEAQENAWKSPKGD